MDTPNERHPPHELQPSIVDYDIHGLAGVRLIGAAKRDVAAVNAQIGDMRGAFPGEPDITVRFVRNVPTTGVLRYVEPREVGFSDDAFFVLRKRGGPAAEIPIDVVGHPCEIVCRSGLGVVPLLRSILDLTLLRKGVAAVHASAFSYNGQGTMVAGWARGAKTTTLLAFMSQGADFIADDRVYVRPDGNQLFGLPEPISIRAQHLDELPHYRGLINRHERARLRALSILGRCAVSVGSEEVGGRKRDLADRVARFGENASAAVRPERLFKQCSFVGTLSRVFLSVPYERSDVIAVRVDPDWLTDRLIFLLRAERQRLVSHYLAFRFAFPDRTSELIEHANDIEHEIVHRVIRRTETYVLYHPFPAPARALFEALAPAVG